MMKPTRRGVVVFALAVTGVVLARLFGPRSLDAVAVPAVVALAAGALQLALAADPSVRRRPLSPTFPGDDHTVSLDVEGGHGVVTLDDAVPEGAIASDPTATVLAPATVSYDVRHEHRGEYVFGPTTVRVHDVFGLFQRTTTAATERAHLVYPPVHDVRERDVLARWLDRGRSTDRQTVSKLREYVPGDSPRDIHWRASARWPDSLLVAEYDADNDETATIAASAPAGAADPMAAATASIAVALLGAGVDVEVTVRDGTASDRMAILSLLARTDHGRPAVGDADITVEAHRSGTVTVTADGRETTFEAMRASRAVGLNSLSEQTDKSDRWTEVIRQ
ncbi:DUF58 domain-containing protein [Halobacteria archaeon HArc-curdl5-1]|uniref:DUF58 domain-containing protein n=3 Tax=Halapricum hydrolyticum TaxID=2979991 RepID=A0AAE3IA09_9EURY|nr:DUF58 domain-containing protein [Halapricum hydrolyticum]MCU4726327.1 DUF58 domain-containing protein [Halapricum hydrolyticum]